MLIFHICKGHAASNFSFFSLKIGVTESQKFYWISWRWPAYNLRRHPSHLSTFNFVSLKNNVYILKRCYHVKWHASWSVCQDTLFQLVTFEFWFMKFINAFTIFTWSLWILCIFTWNQLMIFVFNETKFYFIVSSVAQTFV